MNNKIDQINSELASYVDIKRQKVALQIKATFNEDIQPFISDDEAIIATDRTYENLSRFEKTLMNWCLAFGIGAGLLLAKATDGFTFFVCPPVAIAAYFIIWGSKKSGITNEVQTAQYTIIQGNQARSSPQQEQSQHKTLKPDSGFDVPPQD